MKLIDAGKLLEALGAFTDKKHGDPHFLNGIETAREIVEQMPVASVEAIMEWCDNRNMSIITNELLHYLMSVEYASYGKH